MNRKQKFIRPLLWSVLLYLWGTSSTLYSQINIEQLRKTQNIKKVTETVNLDLSMQTGNTELVLFEAAGRIDYTGEKFGTFLLGKTSQGWEAKERISDEALLHWRSSYKLSRQLLPELFIQFNYDKSRLLAARSIVGLGLRYPLVRDSTWTVYWGSAYMFEHERFNFNTQAKHPNQVSHHRWSNYLSLVKRLNKHAAFICIAYIQPRFDDFKDVRILNDIGLEATLLEPVSLSIAFNWLYDSRPPDTVDSFDTALKSGLVVQW